MAWIGGPYPFTWRPSHDNVCIIVLKVESEPVMETYPLPDVGPRRLAMTRLNVNNARCAALFASELRRSDAPTADELTNWVSGAVRRFGVAGCVSRMAQEFGDHPEAAASRMRWIRQLITQTPAAAAPQPARTARTWQPAGPGRRPARPSGWLSGPGSDGRATHPTTDRAHRAALPTRDRHARDVSSRPRSRLCSRPPRPQRWSIVVARATTMEHRRGYGRGPPRTTAGSARPARSRLPPRARQTDKKVI